MAATAMTISAAGMMTMEERSSQADKIIAGWSLGGLVGNLLPPPFDSMAVGTAMAKMGWEIAKIYEVKMTFGEIKRIGMVLAKGLGAVAAASYIGTGVFKWVPGVNVWVALLMQPPIVGAMSYAAGQSYKRYFEVIQSKGKTLTDEELKKIAETAFLSRKKLFG